MKKGNRKGFESKMNARNWLNSVKDKNSNESKDREGVSATVSICEMITITALFNALHLIIKIPHLSSGHGGSANKWKCIFKLFHHHSCYDTI